MKVVRLDDTKIILELDEKLSSFPEGTDSVQFGINRITGGAELDYLQKPTEDDLKNKLLEGSMLVMSKYSEKGHCAKTQKAL